MKHKNVSNYEIQWYDYDWQYMNLCDKCVDELRREVRSKVNSVMPCPGDATVCEYCEIDGEAED